MSASESSTTSFRPGFLLVIALLVIEITAIGVIYKHLIDFECRANWPSQVCKGASGLLVSVYTMSGALMLLALLLPEGVRRLVAKAGPRKLPLIINLLGVAVMMTPVPLMQNGIGTSNLSLVLGIWAIGITLGATGAMLMLAPVSHWRLFLREYGAVFSFAAAAGLLAPVGAAQIRPLWKAFDGLAELTFTVSSWLIRAFGYDIEAHPEEKIVGAGDFFISIAPACSGIEGMALVSAFITIYLVLFRHELSFPRALIVYPIGVVASALLNVVRIVALLAIGLSGKPELAIGGFHSHAGWLLFTVLAISLVLAASSVPWLHKGGRLTATVPGASNQLPFLNDPVAAQILPFVIFMASALFAQTFSNVPGLLYPWRFLAMAIAVFAFWRIFLNLPWRIDLTSVVCGTAVGFLWIATATETPGTSDLTIALAGLSSLGTVVWVLCRIAGTTFLVPLIEELFFRGYLLDAIRGNGKRWHTFMALVVTSVLFGVLHDRWLAAGLSGVAFGLLKVRSGRVSDAVLAHSVANGIIAAAAVVQSDWSLI